MASKKPFVFRSQIRFSQTDPAGYVFFPRFFELFQTAVEDWFYHGLEVNYAEMFSEGRALPTASTECQFFKPCRLGDMLDLTVKLEKVGTSSMTLKFIGRIGNETHLEAKSVLVMISNETGKSMPIYDDLRTRLGWYAPVGDED